MWLYDKMLETYQLNKALGIYGREYRENRKSIRSFLYYYKDKKHYNIAVWGAGLKGKAFLKIIDPDQRFIKYVYDIDKRMFGKSLPTGHKIVDFKMKYNQDIKVVLLMNNNFETVTANLLAEQNMKVILINVDSVIAGSLDANSVLQLYGKDIK